jgi:hypothetical protein
LNACGLNVVQAAAPGGLVAVICAGVHVAEPHIPTAAAALADLQHLDLHADGLLPQDITAQQKIDADVTVADVTSHADPLISCCHRTCSEPGNVLSKLSHIIHRCVLFAVSVLQRFRTPLH